MEVAEALSSPLCSSKSKAWTGFKKSAAALVDADDSACRLVDSVCGVLSSFSVEEVSSTLWVGGKGAVLISIDFLILADLDTVVFLVLLAMGLVADLDGCLVDTFTADLVAGFATDLATGLTDDFVDGLRGDFLVVEVGVAGFFVRRVTSPSIDLFLSIVYNYNMARLKITKKQQALLNFLEDFTEENGYSPSYREIMVGLGLSSVSAVAEHIDNMVSKGILRKVPGAARSLEVLDFRHTETVELFKTRLNDASDEERKVLLAAADILGLDLED